MSGLIEILLTERYGQPIVIPSEPLAEYRWNDEIESSRSILYKTLVWKEELCARFADLTTVYGDAVGGSILLGSLKVSMLVGPKVFGLYRIKDLQRTPSVLRALEHDASVCFFMDAANVWYYGVKGQELYVFDSETDELDCLGPVQSGLSKLLSEWELAKR